MDSQPRGFWRSFFHAFAATAGICCAIIFLIAFSGIFFGSGEKTTEIEYNYSPQILANAQNIRKELPETSPVILQINVKGIIGLDSLTTDRVRELLIESREQTLAKSRVKAILLNINSPGGSAIDSDSIYQLIKNYKIEHHVPVYAYVDGLCASGGMYIACASDKIYASDASIIGSIGVIVPSVLNFHNLLTTLGIDSKTLSAGKGKDELNPVREWSKDEGQNYQDLVDSLYQTFVNVVVSNRPKVDREKLIVEYGAHIFPATKATEIGYIDGNGYSYTQALALLAKDAGLGQDAYQVIELKEKNWLFSWLKGQSNPGTFKWEINHRLDLPKEYDAKLMNQFLYLHR